MRCGRVEVVATALSATVLNVSFVCICVHIYNLYASVGGSRCVERSRPVSVSIRCLQFILVCALVSLFFSSKFAVVFLINFFLILFRILVIVLLASIDAPNLMVVWWHHIADRS